MLRYCPLNCLLGAMLVSASLFAQEFEKNQRNVDPSGTWVWEQQFGSRKISRELRLQKDGATVSGTLKTTGGFGSRGGRPQSSEIKNATLKGDEISFQIVRKFGNNEFTTNYAAVIAGDELAGLSASKFGGQIREAAWLAKRVVTSDDTTSSNAEVDKRDLETSATAQRPHVAAVTSTRPERSSRTGLKPAEILTLWPEGKAPGPTRVDPQQGEQLVTSRRRTFRQYTNISVPTVAVFLPKQEKRTGAAVLVCPGGGMQRLAYEHEGLEVAEWLNSLGITVFVVKYRVPAPSSTALLDVQRAMGLIRQRAEQFQIDPDRIGAMGFSAGGELALLLATNYAERGYEKIDDADGLSCKPSHACLIYPGGIYSRRGGALRQDIAEKLDGESTPSMFIVHAFSDASLNSLALGVALKEKGIPSELHIYQEGGHGFGARESALPLSGWKSSYVQWIRAQGFLDAPFVSGYASYLASNLRSAKELQPMSKTQPKATLADAFAVQRKVVRSLSKGDKIIGFKSGPVTPDPTNAEGPAGPATGALFQSGRIAANSKLEFDADELGKVAVETELGFIVSRGLDISTRVTNVEQIKGAFEKVVRVVEIPFDLGRRMSGEITSLDMVAANIGSNRVLIASDGESPDDFDPDKLEIGLTKDGETLHTVQGNPVEGGIWERLIVVVNRIVDQGYTLRSGDVVISGALGRIHSAERGSYVADFGQLGKIEFAIK